MAREQAAQRTLRAAELIPEWRDVWGERMAALKPGESSAPFRGQPHGSTPQFRPLRPSTGPILPIWSWRDP